MQIELTVCFPNSGKRIIDRYTNKYSVMLMSVRAFISRVTVGFFLTRGLRRELYKAVKTEIAAAQQLLYNISITVVVAGTAAFPSVPNPPSIQYHPRLPQLKLCPGSKSTIQTSFSNFLEGNTPNYCSLYSIGPPIGKCPIGTQCSLFEER